MPWHVSLPSLPASPLSPQAVLEGLNALLDHRAEVFIPELGASYHCHPQFRLFGAQNPLQVRPPGSVGEGRTRGRGPGCKGSFFFKDVLSL